MGRKEPLGEKRIMEPKANDNKDTKEEGKQGKRKKRKEKEERKKPSKNTVKTDGNQAKLGKKQIKSQQAWQET